MYIKKISQYYALRYMYAMPSDLCLGHSDLLLSMFLQLEQSGLPHLKILDLENKIDKNTP